MTAGRHPDARMWWGALLVLFGVALLVQTTGLIPGWASSWFGAAVLAAIGAGFLAVYLARPARWWAVIPAGTLFSLAVVAAIGPLLPGPVSGAIFLFGLGATFAAVALVPAPGAPRGWAWIPAVVLGLLAAASLGAVAAVLWPLALIAVGAYLLFAWARRASRPGG